MIQLIGVILAILKALAEYASNKQLLDAGMAKVIANNAHDSLEKLKSANAARAAANSVPASDDKYNRDNRPKP